MASHLLKYAVSDTSLQTHLSEYEVIEAITSSYTSSVQKMFYTSNLNTIQDTLNVLNKLEAIESQHHIHSNGLIRTGYIHAAVLIGKTTRMVGLTQYDSHT